MIGRRADGFHDIETTIQSIDLHDLLTVTTSTDETLLTTSGLSVTNATDNSVLKAHAALELACRKRLPAHFHLHKRIPPGSGLGGASSDAAAALRGLKQFHHLDIDLTAIAEDLGADVPFFLHGGRMRAEGRGEKLTPLTMQPGGQAMYMIMWPGIELSTKAVYAAWDEVKGDGPNELRRAAEHVAPEIKLLSKSLGSGWRMTGSGSAFFKETTTNDVPDIKAWTTVAHAVGRWS